MSVRERPDAGPAIPAPPASHSGHDAAHLPTWPVGVLFGGLPLWWASGLLDVVALPFAVLMAWLLSRRTGVRVPRGFGWWLFYCAWAGASAVMLDHAAGLLSFGYRWLLSAAAGVLFVYVFNARATLTSRYLSGCLTLWFTYTTVGGYLGLLLPTAVLRTPLSQVLPGGLTSNPLVNQMVVRPFAQYKATGFLREPPRPSAPFLYTNNWGSVYALIVPFVIVYILHTRSQLRGRLAALVLLVSVVPAFLTLNRGMFISLGIAAVYLAGHALLHGRWRPVALVVAAAVAGTVLFNVLPVSERLATRLPDDAVSTSTDTRLSLYEQSLDAARSSPLLGHGAPIESENPKAPPVGTQGQIWMVLVSHGPMGALAWVAFFLAAYRRGRQRDDPIGVASSITTVVGLVQLLFYGMLPYGLPLLMVAAAIGARGADPAPPRPAVGAAS